MVQHLSSQQGLQGRRRGTQSPTRTQPLQARLLVRICADCRATPLTASPNLDHGLNKPQYKVLLEQHNKMLQQL